MDVLKSFILGGSLIGGSKFISQYIDPSYSPLFAGLPIGLLTMLFINGSENKTKYCRNYILSTSILLLILLFIQFILNDINEKSIIICFGLWFFTSFLLIKYRK
tara:strand:+ start:1040 stop:1351 length:312 start_codon:yes stop_codon:yes gene_type:complete